MKPRRAAIIIGILAVVLSGNTQDNAQAQSDSIDTEISYHFGEIIRFFAHVQNDASIARAAVFLQPLSASTAKVLLAKVDATDTASAVLEIDPGLLTIFAFETLTYWWQIDLSTGEVFTTGIMQMEYADDRFQWQSLDQNEVEIFWHDRNLSEGQAILETASRAIVQISNSFTLTQRSPIKIIVYNSSQELGSAISLIGLNQTAGHAEPELGIMLVSASSGSQGLIDLERLIPHELVHLLLERTNSETSLLYPAWLAEGMATMVEGTPSASASSSLEAALSIGTPIRFVDLCSSFPISGEASQLAYAQSASFIRYLIDVYGVGGIQQLLDAYQEGVSCTGGVQRVYQRSLDQLQSEWESVAWENPPTENDLILVGIPALFFILFLIVTLRRRGWLTSIANNREDEGAR